MVIYTAAGTHPIQSDYSHGSHFPCQNLYIHGYRASSIKVLFTQQPFLIPKGLYTRLPCIKYKTAVFTRQPFLIPKGLYTRLPCIKYKSGIYNASVSHTKRFEPRHEKTKILSKPLNHGGFSMGCNICGHFYQFKWNLFDGVQLDVAICVVVYRCTMWKLFMAFFKCFKTSGNRVLNMSGNRKAANSCQLGKA